MEENILTADQVAQKLQVHPFTVLKFIKQGKLKASKLGRVYRIRESDVMIFLDEQQANSPSRAKSSPKKSPSIKEISPSSPHLVGELPEEALQAHQVTSNQDKPVKNSPSNPQSPSGTETTKPATGNKAVPKIQNQPIQNLDPDEEILELDHYILD